MALNLNSFKIHYFILLQSNGPVHLDWDRSHRIRDTWGRFDDIRLFMWSPGGPHGCDLGALRTLPCEERSIDGSPYINKKIAVVVIKKKKTRNGTCHT